MSKFYRLYQWNTLNIALNMHIALYNNALFAAVSLVHTAHPPYCVITLLLARLLPLLSQVKWPSLGTHFSGPSTDPSFRLILHLATCHTKLATRYVATSVLMLLPLYASSRAVVYRLAPTVDAIKSRDCRLHPCDGSFLGAAAL